MLYREYLKSAEKHLKFCKSFIANQKQYSYGDFDVYLDIFYIAGYILEGLTVYSTYKINGWPAQIDIKEYNEDFVNRTHLDFYHKRTITLNDGRTQNVKIHGLKVQGHNFQQIAKEKLVNQGPFANDNTTPFYGNGNLDYDVRFLIEHWKPEIRYYYQNYAALSLFPTLNLDLINRLINTCTIIFTQTICKIGLEL